MDVNNLSQCRVSVCIITFIYQFFCKCHYLIILDVIEVFGK